MITEEQHQNIEAELNSNGFTNAVKYTMLLGIKKEKATAIVTFIREWPDIKSDIFSGPTHYKSPRNAFETELSFYLN